MIWLLWTVIALVVGLISVCLAITAFLALVDADEAASMEDEL